MDKSYIWHPFTPLVTETEPIFIDKGKGVYLYTKDGRKIIDAVSSWWVNIHGHSNETIAKAIYEQAMKLEHVIFAGFTHEPAQTLSENLMTILPKDFAKVFFSDNGSTSIEVALKMAFQYWYNLGKTNKTKIIAFDGAYHGDTFGAMSVGARSGFTKPFFPFLFDVEYIDIPKASNFESVLVEFEKLINNPDTAGFIFEPLVQGAGGMRMYSAEHLNQMITIAREAGVICIADEVMTGFGRTGKIFASDHMPSDPDIMCISKGITGGTLPLGITACNQKIVDVFESESLDKALLHGHSYTGNPLTCAASNASFGLLMDQNCKDARMMIEKKHRTFLSKITHHQRVRNARVTGTIFALDIFGFGETSYDNDIRKKVFPFFLEKGILLRPLGNVIYILPPFVIKENELDMVYNAIEEFLDQLS